MSCCSGWSPGKPCCGGESIGYGVYGGFGQLTAAQQFQLQQQQLTGQQAFQQQQLTAQQKQASQQQAAQLQRDKLLQQQALEQSRLLAQGRETAGFQQMMASAMQARPGFVVPTGPRRGGGGAVVAVSILAGLAVVGGVMYALLKSASKA